MTARHVLVSGIRQGDYFAHRWGRTNRETCIATRDAEINTPDMPVHLVKVWGTYSAAGGRTIETWWGVDRDSHVELLETADERALRAEVEVVTRERDTQARMVDFLTALASDEDVREALRGVA